MRHEPKSKGTDIAGALDYLNQVRSRRCITLVFSDFLDHNYENSLRQSAQLHDLVCVSLSDLRERELPRSGMLEMMDAETGVMRTIDCSDSRLRERVMNKSNSKHQQLQNLCHEVNADLLPLCTEDDFLYEIIRFFRDRNNRSADTR